MLEKLLPCRKCEGQPSSKNVFATGAYYKCMKCDFPHSQFPIAQSEGMKRKQWNELNKTT